MSGPETRLVHRILAALREKYPGGYFRKIHGNPYQHAGIPDIIGCVESFFIGLEVKTESGRVSTIQRVEGEEITRSKGIYAVVTSVEEALEVMPIQLSLNSKKLGRRIRQF